MEVVKKTQPKKFKKNRILQGAPYNRLHGNFYRDPKRPCNQSVNVVRLQAPQYWKNPSFNQPKWGLQLHLRGMEWAHLRCQFDKGIRVLQHPWAIWCSNGRSWIHYCRGSFASQSWPFYSARETWSRTVHEFSSSPEKARAPPFLALGPLWAPLSPFLTKP